MDYVFGATDNYETLRTKGSKHSDLSGFCTIVREYPDQTVTDRFRIRGRYMSSEDTAGNCYDWYAIADHSRDTDKTAPIKADLAAAKEELETAMCEHDEEASDRMTAIEDAICDMDAALCSEEG